MTWCYQINIKKLLTANQQMVDSIFNEVVFTFTNHGVVSLKDTCWTRQGTSQRAWIWQEQQKDNRPDTKVQRLVLEN